MTSPASEFEWRDRGFRKTLLLVPGWATDHRIFAPLDLEFNYLAPTVFSPRDFKERLLDAMGRYRLERVAVLGWSLGGYLALEFACEHPERIVEGALFAVGMREHYERDAIEATRSRLARSRAAYLRRFYEACFSAGEREARSWFERELLAAYLERMELNGLLEALDYLAGASLAAQAPGGMKVTFIHGSLDRIAPVEAMLAVRARLPGAELVRLEAAGHAAFLNPQFKRVFDGSGG